MEAWAIVLGGAGIAATLVAGYWGARRSYDAKTTTVHQQARVASSDMTVNVPQPIFVHAPVTLHAPPAPTNVTLQTRMPSNEESQAILPKQETMVHVEAPGELEDDVEDDHPGRIHIQEELEVEGGSYERLEFVADPGDRIEGLIESDGVISVHLVPRPRYPAYLEGSLSGIIEVANDSKIIHIDERLRKGGVWFLIIDASLKRNSRTVTVDVEVSP